MVDEISGVSIFVDASGREGVCRPVAFMSFSLECIKSEVVFSPSERGGCIASAILCSLITGSLSSSSLVNFDACSTGYRHRVEIKQQVGRSLF